MTYCLGIVTKSGLVMASDSRTNAGYDQVNTCRKMYTFVKEGERVFVLLASGSLSCTQSVITLLKRDFDKGEGLAKATLDVRCRPHHRQRNPPRRRTRSPRPRTRRLQIQRPFPPRRPGQRRTARPLSHLPQGNPLQATEESPYLQIGETKYGRPILDRGIRFEKTTLEEAAKYALLSLDSTMKSNVTVGPPIDLLAYETDHLAITHQRRFLADDADLDQNRHCAGSRPCASPSPGLPNIRFLRHQGRRKNRRNRSNWSKPRASPQPPAPSCNRSRKLAPPLRES